EEVIVPVPAFSLYETIVTVAGGRVVPLDVSKTGFQITPEALNPLVTEKTKAIILNSPNNPTGVVLNEKSLAAVKEAVLGRPVFVISDNVYSLLSYGPCPDLSLDGELKEQLILCQSFSKPYAMTGWRLGYLVCPEYVMDRLLLLSAGTIAAVPTFLQEAGLAALKEDTTPMREIYRRRRDKVTSRLRSMGLDFPEPEGAFYVFADIRKYGMTSDEFCTRLIREGRLAAVPGSCFGVEGYLRLSYCYSDAELQKGLDRLEGFLKGL
ncbi:MAG: pyridoxal phosphate-dependent aminotransferase, partial [Faecousia sp.]